LAHAPGTRIVSGQGQIIAAKLGQMGFEDLGATAQVLFDIPWVGDARGPRRPGINWDMPMAPLMLRA
jgi:hypothetical protein